MSRQFYKTAHLVQICLLAFSLMPGEVTSADLPFAWGSHRRDTAHISVHVTRTEIDVNGKAVPFSMDGYEKLKDMRNPAIPQLKSLLKPLADEQRTSAEINLSRELPYIALFSVINTCAEVNIDSFAIVTLKPDITGRGYIRLSLPSSRGGRKIPKETLVIITEMACTIGRDGSFDITLKNADLRERMAELQNELRMIKEETEITTIILAGEKGMKVSNFVSAADAALMAGFSTLYIAALRDESKQDAE